MQLPARLGKYELQQFLGGGMSHVYRAFDTMIGRTVAVKILTEQGAQDAETRDRFLDEARTAAKVSHENVINIFDFGVDDEKGLFMVMEFLQGEDLRQAIKNGHTGDIRDKLKIALQVARALDFIHRNKIVHRDIKPENIHINAAGVVKLMDFGIAKSEDFSRTQPGYVLGTPYYMAPEQVRGEPITGQVDVYAFGVLLFELFTGRKVFSGDSVERIFYSILNVPLNLEPLEQAGVPRPVIHLIAACNAKAAADRPQGFGPIIADLEGMLASPASGVQVAQPAPPAASRRNALLIPAGIVVALALAIGGYLALKPGSAPKATELAKTIATPTGEMVLVPGGEFRFGEKKQVTSLPAFYIDKTEVSNAAYAQFCQATQHPLPGGFPANRPAYPVVSVTIADARAFAQWAGKRLPTDLEWEKAARGSDGRTFPWGSEVDNSRANVGTRELRPVDSYPSGASPYGALQMVGNAWELVDKLRPAAADLSPFQSLQPPLRSDEAWYMIRGLSAWTPLVDGATWDSTAVPERWKDSSLSFRCAKDAK